jgi:DNA polymerase-3 subunit gamma/tau
MALLKAIQLSPASSIPDLIAKMDRLASGMNGDGTTRNPTGAPGGRSGPTNFRV